jgi:hypothetical protein
VNWSALASAILYGAVAASLWGSLIFIAKANAPKQGAIFGVMMFGHGLAALGLSLTAIFDFGLAMLSLLPT